MIPKIIHYCWLSDDPLPSNLRKCIDTWHSILPDYEIRLWNYHNFPRGKSAWVDEAFDNRKFAFAADYIRSYALYNHGGIYLDSDVEVLRSFNPLLSLPYFIGKESSSGMIEAATMGAHKGHPMFKMLLDFYDTHHFRRDDDTLDVMPMPVRFYNLASEKFKLNDIETPEEFVDDENVLNILPSDYFSPIEIQTMRLVKTPRTYSIHRFAGSWKPAKTRLRKRLQVLLGHNITSAIQRVKHSLGFNRKAKMTEKVK